MTLPDCMMPDGAEPCRGYLELQARSLEMENIDLATIRIALNDLIASDRLVEQSRLTLAKIMSECARRENR